MQLLASLFQFKLSPWELVLRGTAVYWFLFLMFRFVLRRDTGAVGIADILLLVIIADASQNAMAGQYTTVPEGFVLVATLLAWNVLLDWASFRWEAVRRLAEPPPLLLVDNGRVLARNLRREFVTMNELMASLRRNGVEDVRLVRRAFMESDGSFSVILKSGVANPGGGARDDRRPV